jgi:hypothetical protein
MKDTGEIDGLRQAWQERAGKDRAGDGCPGDEKIWEALRGELAQHEVDGIVRHTAGCPACAEAWRLAREMGAMDEREIVAEPAEPARAAPWWRLRPVALAAGLVLLVGVGAAVVLSLPERGGEEVTYRDTGPDAIRALTPEDKPLPREAFRLAWSPGPEGARYSVRVTTVDLEQLDLAEGLREAAHTVPASALRDLAPGTRLLWQVEVFHPDGRRATSPTFFATIR